MTAAAAAATASSVGRKIRRQVNSATLIMGPTGSGKSFLLGTLAEWLWETHHKILRLNSCDGGGLPANVEKNVHLGIIQLFRMRTRDMGDSRLAPETCYRVAQGWWPAKIRPATGEVPVGVPMVAPIRTRFNIICKEGHVADVVALASLVTTPRKCKVCGTLVNAQTALRVDEVQTMTPGYEKVGAIAFDGLTSMLSWQLLEMGHRAGKLELKGEESALGGKVKSGDLTFGGTNRAHVGFAQTRGEELVHLAMGIPNLVVPPVFTALTHEDVDDRSINIRGPKIAGRAKTDEAGAWVGNCLEAAIIPAEVGSGQQRVLYLDEFVDNAGVKHLVKNRAAPGTMPARLIDPPEDKLHPELAGTQFNLGLFFQMLAEALDKSIEDGKQQFPDAPGLPEEEEVSYGDAESMAAAANAQAQPTGPVAAGAPASPVVAPATPSAPAAPKAAAPRKAAAPKKAPQVVPAPAGDGGAPAAEKAEASAAAAAAAAEPQLPLTADTGGAPDAAPPVNEPDAGGAPATAAGHPAPAATVVASPVAARPTPARPMMAPPPGARPAAPARPAALAPAGAPRIPAPAPRPTGKATTT